jgi:isoleucyl-tRNA synthetase
VQRQGLCRLALEAGGARIGRVVVEAALAPVLDVGLGVEVLDVRDELRTLGDQALAEFTEPGSGEWSSLFRHGGGTVAPGPVAASEAVRLSVRPVNHLGPSPLGPSALLQEADVVDGVRWPDVPARPDLPALEHEVLARWQRDDVFRRSVEQRADGPVWTFYEGPPTANGRPGVHHVESRVFKDVFPRYRTMKGSSVRRKGGWDCHGLPVELEVERELGLDSKADIEAYGIEAFNARCRESVQRYVGAFEELTERIGFWIDTDDAYRTMDADYIESLWWALGELWDRDLLFEDFRVAPYCGRCGTALSDAEVSLGYDEVTDPSVFVRLPLTDAPDGLEDASLVVWTTTPWTLPSNVACAVGPGLTYAVVDRTTSEGATERLVVATDLVTAVLGDDVTVVTELAGTTLVGLRYRPPFDHHVPDGDAHRVVAADFVTTTDGTGIVHLAPAFGGDDMMVGRREGLPILNPVGPDARFLSGPWAGRFVKDADEDIIAALAASGLLIARLPYTHSYPFCWRCKQPLIYWAKPSWYIRTTARRDELLANNAGIGWSPEHIRDGRFGNWLENNVDWALSRDRYWGTPLPFWRCDDCRGVTVVRSRAQLSELSGADHSTLDPHRPFVDDVTLPCQDCGGTARRVPEVADAWFDSGGMPFAQWGYPHRGHEEFERHYPADYICEAIDQTRGWFYSLLAESTLLFGDSSYRNCVCLGHIVDEDGRKMSKSAGNVVDPWTVTEVHGADALRWLMFADGNPWVSRRVGPQQLDDVVRRFLLTIWNTHLFFVTYARIDGFDPASPAPAVGDRPITDRWILAELASTIDAVDHGLDTYDVSSATRRIERFVDDVSNWYVRRSRRRFWRGVEDAPEDKAAAYHTLHTVLTTLARLLAPFTPFVAERLWQDLVVSVDPTAPDSVHLTDFPNADPTWRDEAVVAAMATGRRLVELGRQARTESGLRVRQPLARALVSVPARDIAGLALVADEVAEELNLHAVDVADANDGLVDRTLRPNFRALGPAFGPDAPAVAAALSSLDSTRVEELLAGSASGDLMLDVGDRTLALSPEMYEVVEQPRTGWSVVSDGAHAVALDTTLTPELELEGAARELVRAVNEQRKVLGLELSDRIALELAIEPVDVGERLDAAGHLALVAREVLATDLRLVGALDDPADSAGVPLGGLGDARIRVTRT